MQTVVLFKDYATIKENWQMLVIANQKKIK